MADIAAIIQSGAHSPWLYLPAALLLGALHALEPGHSKSMMAAFIIAIRGTPLQAVVLGLSAAIGHSLVIWVLAALGLWLGDRLILEKAEPWLMLATGLLVITLAIRIFYNLAGPAPDCGHDHHGHDHHGNHPHSHEHHGHEHHHDHNDHHRHDAHAAAHADDIRTRLQGQSITTGQIAWFGLSAGLLPCPAALAVLLICLQLKQIALGLSMVAAFSAGLAITLVGIGVAASWAVRKMARPQNPAFSSIVHWLPYASAAIILLVGSFMTLRGLTGLGVFAT